MSVAANQPGQREDQTLRDKQTELMRYILKVLVNIDMNLASIIGAQTVSVPKDATDGTD